MSLYVPFKLGSVVPPMSRNPSLCQFFFTIITHHLKFYSFRIPRYIRVSNSGTECVLL